MANRNRGSRRVERRAHVRQATGVAIAECDDCGGGKIVLIDRNERIFAEAHFPANPQDWLTSNFIPALLEACHNREATRESAILAEHNQSLLRHVPLEFEWSENDVRHLIMDARTTGVGGYENIIDNDTWVENNIKLLSEIGPDEYFRHLLDVMHRTFAPGQTPSWLQKPKTEEPPLK